MAFYNWIDSPVTVGANQNVETENEFSADNQRTSGFSAGQEISELRVNSAIRQSSLVVCALMDALGISNKNLTSARTDVATDISNKLNSELSYVPISGTTALLGSIIPQNTSSYSLGSSNKKFNTIYSKYMYVDVGDSNLEIGNRLYYLLDRVGILTSKSGTNCIFESGHPDKGWIDIVQCGYNISMNYERTAGNLAAVNAGQRLYLSQATPSNSSNPAQSWLNLDDKYLPSNVTGSLFGYTSTSFTYLGCIGGDKLLGLWCELVNNTTTSMKLVGIINGYNRL